MNKQASLKSYLSIHKDIHQGKGEKRTQPPLTREAVKKQKMVNKFDKIQLLSPEKTPLTSPQKQLISSSKPKISSRFYDIDKDIDSPTKSLNIKTSQNLYQTQIDSYTNKKNKKRNIIEIESESEDEIDSKINTKNNLRKKEEEKEKEKEKRAKKDVPVTKQTQELDNLKNQNVEDFIKDIFNSTEKIKNKLKKEEEIKQLKPQLPQHEVKLKAGISAIDLSKNIIPLLLSERKLKLPEKYEKLQKLFEALDHILRYDKAMNRQSILFTNLIKRLENICHSKVTNKQLGQIMKVYPESYYLRAFRAKDGNINWYIDFNNSASALDQAIQAGKLADIRRKTFRQNLLNYVYKEYDKFLEQKGQKINDYSKLNNWDPEFDLENVPDIDPVELPSPPLFKNQLDIEKRLLDSKPKAPKALIRKSELVAIKNKQNDINTSKTSIKRETSNRNITSAQSLTPSTSSSTTTESSIPTSISTSKSASTTTTESDHKPKNEAREKISALRLRLREKDRLRKLKLQQTPVEIRKNALIGKLPEIIKTLKKYYVSKKTTSLPYNEVRNMLQISCSVNTFGGVDEHIKLLIDINIECCRKVPTVNYGTYLKFFPEKVDDTLKKIEEMKSKNEMKPSS